MTLAGQVEEAVVEDDEKDGKGKKKRKSAINPGETRLALTLIAPTIALLLLIVGYPVAKAIYQSFLTDPGLDSATGL
ncbi:MAG: trehalose/maltose transport system permease protein, partial [Actinoplanes sp.]|nr:trehalose/maltose transport system permease protein [Actinoplanes sp.]